MSLGEWLNSVILEQTADDDDHDHDETYADELANVHQRLDDLTHRIEQFTRKGPEAYAPKRTSHETDQIAELIDRLDRRLEQFVHSARVVVEPMGPAAPPSVAPPMVPAPPPFVAPAMAPPISPAMAPRMPPPVMPNVQLPPSLGRAIAEITARQRALNGMPTQPTAPAPALPQGRPPEMVPAAPLPTQDLSGLEDQLRRITDQIETLRRPGVEEAINALRAELGEIGRALNEAMPRHAIDTIEKQIQGLTQRIAEGRQNGIDNGALSGIEHGLAEVRDALRGLTPAEKLVGFNEAVNALAHKIDLIVAQKDPATLQQLERAITTLRDMATHVASGEAVNSLAAQVQILGEKIENISVGGVAGDALTNLENRIGALADALAERAHDGNIIPPRLEALVQSLSDKIGQIQQSRGDNIAVGHLEDRIVKLVERLDSSDSRFGHLEAIERGLADLLVHIQDIRGSKEDETLRGENTTGVDALKHDIARTQNALDAVNGTLGQVVERLTMIENDIRSSGRRQPAPDSEPLELTQPVATAAVRAASNEPEPAPRMPSVAPPQMPPVAPAPARPAAAAPQHQAAPKRMPAATVGPTETDLPPDQPLEPGSGPPRIRAGARIAASEAALGNARPAPAAGGKSSFIAAARRAAQTAVHEAGTRMPRAQANAVELDGVAKPSSLRTKMMKRVKSLFIAASIVAIVVGSVQVMGNLFRSAPHTQLAKNAKVSDAATATREASTFDVKPETPLNFAANPLQSARSPDDIAPASGIITATTPSLFNPPVLSGPPAPASKNDVTGSISRSTGNPRPSGLPVSPASGDRLPLAIGGPRLRSAAVSGDGAAAYEVAMRFAEGRGVPVNLEEAARWYERAAVQGLAPAQFRYASLLEKGNGVKKDLGQARQLYLAAAAKGNAKSMHNLAVLYAEGIDGKPDYATAAQWFRKAALHGIADSEYNLGVLAARGLGTAKNLTESYKWFALAAAQGDKEAARKRDEVATQLDPQALAAAQHAVKSFVATPQPRDAVLVPAPAGGWDDAVNAPAPLGTPRVSRPLSLGTFKVGKR
jgi:localization factor PodJL